MQKSTKWAIAFNITTLCAIVVIVWIVLTGMDDRKFLTFCLLWTAMCIAYFTGFKEWKNEQSSGSEDL